MCRIRASVVVFLSAGGENAQAKGDAQSRWVARHGDSSCGSVTEARAATARIVKSLLQELLLRPVSDLISFVAPTHRGRRVEA
jgi:hypothetical protein